MLNMTKIRAHGVVSMTLYGDLIILETPELENMFNHSNLGLIQNPHRIRRPPSNYQKSIHNWIIDNVHKEEKDGGRS